MIKSEKNSKTKCESKVRKRINCMKNNKKIMKLLVVEDNLIVQFAIQQLLKGLDCAVDFAEDGKTALAFYDSTYALILMDIELPDLNGIEVTKTIRAVEKKQHSKQVPIIAITSHYDEVEYQKRCKEVGMNECANKPDLAHLKKWISEYIVIHEE